MQDATPAERWVPIPDHPGYEVSDLGHVRGIDRVIIQTNGKRLPWRGRTLRLWPDKDGYLCVRLGQGRRHHVHALVLEAFIGPRPPDADALHINGGSGDERLANLRWGSRSENCLDLVRHGTHHYARRTMCPRNHPLAPPNLDPSNMKADGTRACWACAKARRRARYFRDRGWTVLDLQAESDAQYARILRGAARTRSRAS